MAITGGNGSKKDSGSKSKFLTFHLGNEKYGIPVLKTREIIGANVAIHELPNFPACHKGVIELRNETFSIIDLKMLFGMGETNIADKTSIVIVEIQKPDQTVIQIGLLVDHVDEVMDFLDSEIESGSSAGQPEFEHIIGFGKKKTVDGQNLVIILDIDKAIDSI